MQKKQASQRRIPTEKRTFAIVKETSKTTMADNYLERQYEAYEARKAAWEKAKKLGKTRKPKNNSKEE